MKRITTTLKSAGALVWGFSNLVFGLSLTVHFSGYESLAVIAGLLIALQGMWISYVAIAHFAEYFGL